MLSALVLQRHTDRVQRSAQLPLTRVSLLCGPNGSGKSTVLDALNDLITGKPPFPDHDWTTSNVPIVPVGAAKAIFCFSFERDNPRTVDLRWAHSGAAPAAVVSRCRSHGQSNYALLSAAFDNEAFDVMVLDEPEAALDLDGLLQLRELLMSTDKQVLLATHSPLLLSLKGEQEVSILEFGPQPGYAERVLQAYVGVLRGERVARVPRLELADEGDDSDTREDARGFLVKRVRRPLTRS